MLSKKFLISVISTLVFAFPLIYQPLHDVEHHSDYHEHHDGLSTSKEKCLVYEYQFAHFDLPTEIFIIANPFIQESTSYFEYTSPVYSIAFYSNSSRAPPKA